MRQMVICEEVHHGFCYNVWYEMNICMHMFDIPSNIDKNKSSQAEYIICLLYTNMYSSRWNILIEY